MNWKMVVLMIFFLSPLALAAEQNKGSEIETWVMPPLLAAITAAVISGACAYSAGKQRGEERGRETTLSKAFDGLHPRLLPLPFDLPDEVGGDPEAMAEAVMAVAMVCAKYSADPQDTVDQTTSLEEQERLAAALSGISGDEFLEHNGELNENGEPRYPNHIRDDGRQPVDAA